MKKMLLVFGCLFCITLMDTVKVLAANNCEGPFICENSEGFTYNVISGCDLYGANECYKSGTDTLIIQNCFKCSSGYTSEVVEITIEYGICNNLDVTYKGCKKDGGTDPGCTACNPPCSSDVTVTPEKVDGYVSVRSEQCNLNTCSCYSKSELYCAKGWYREEGVFLGCFDLFPTGERSCSGCKPCPLYPLATTNSEYGTPSITSCYIPAGFEIPDTSGKYEYTNDCYY